QFAGLAQTAYQLQIDVMPGGGGVAVHLENFQSFDQAGTLGDAARLNRAGHWRNGGNADDGNDPEGHDGEQEVGHRAGGDNGDALFDALAVEGLIQLVRIDRRLALVEHRDVATEGYGGNQGVAAVSVMPPLQRGGGADAEG